MHYTGTIIITDPCYIGQGDFDDKPKAPSLMKTGTIYGDWSCTVFRVPKDMEWKDVLDYEGDLDELGRFCADCGQVGVCLLDDLMNDKDTLRFIIEHSWCVAVIPDFDGEVTFETFTDPDGYQTVHVVGKGSKNFVTVQTGL